MPAAAPKIVQETPLETLSKETGLSLSYTTELVKDVATDILLTVLSNTGEKDEETKAKVRESLKELWPESLFMDDRHTPTPYLMLGIPGHGKTTVYREASRLVCGLMGWNMLDNPDRDQPITSKSFIFMSVEFAGQNSTFSYKGIPVERKDGDSEEGYMDYLKERLFTKMHQAAGGVMLLDDIGNATSSLMNAALPMLAERRYNRTDMKKMYIGATGNLGSLDGTKISGYSSALLGRAKVVLVRDRVEDLSARIREKYAQDIISDCFFSHFLRRQGQSFIEQIPEPGRLTPVPSPRSLEHAVAATRVEVMKVGGPSNGISALEPAKFQQNVGSLIGREASDQLSAYLLSAYQHADPAARMMIETGKFHPALDEHAKIPNSIESMMFYAQFGSALADYASLRLKDKGQTAFDETVNNYCTGLYQLQGASQTSALSLFKDRLVYSHGPLYSVPQGNNGKRVLEGKVYHRLLQLFSKHPDASADDWRDITSVLSEAGLYDIETTPANNGAAPRARAAATGVGVLPNKKKPIPTGGP